MCSSEPVLSQLEPFAVSEQEIKNVRIKLALECKKLALATGQRQSWFGHWLRNVNTKMVGARSLAPELRRWLARIAHLLIVRSTNYLYLKFKLILHF